MLRILRAICGVLVVAGGLVLLFAGFIVSAIVGFFAYMASLGAPFILLGLIALRDWLIYHKSRKK